MTRTIKEWQEYVRSWAISKGFDWKPSEIDLPLLRIHSEVSEAGEAVRDNDMEQLAEEFADIFIRLVDACEVMSVDLEAETERKMAINEKRPYLHGRARR